MSHNNLLNLEHILGGKQCAFFAKGKQGQQGRSSVMEGLHWRELDPSGAAHDVGPTHGNVSGGAAGWEWAWARSTEHIPQTVAITTGLLLFGWKQQRPFPPCGWAATGEQHRGRCCPASPKVTPKPFTQAYLLKLFHVFEDLATGSRTSTLQSGSCWAPLACWFSLE